MGGAPGKVGNIIGSCNGDKACSKVGSSFGHDSSVGNIKRSCNYELSCFKVGYDGGLVGDFVNSCSGYKACYDAGEPKKEFVFGVGDIVGPGGLGNVMNSCNAAKACFAFGASANPYTTSGGGTGPITSNIVGSCCNIPNECMGMNETTLHHQCLIPPTKVRLQHEWHESFTSFQ